jgi:myo-inositol-1(or 4)-monophosphatase
VTDWLEECRGAVRDLREVFEGLPARADREAILRAGVGGDDTTAIDDAAERKVVERLERLHAGGGSFTLISEELGERRFGDGGSSWIVLDPVDGSVNAKRGIPFFALSIAVAEGPTMGDVTFGYVYDFGSGEEWTAVRGEGARLNGAPLVRELPKDEIEILVFEATKTASVADRVGAMVGLAERLRIMGSLAISLCHLAAGRVDAVCSLKGARSVDIAAAQLLVRECGLAIDLPEAPPFEAAPLDLVGRSRVVAGASPEVCARLFAALSA